MSAREFQHFLLAVMYFTRLPVSLPLPFAQDQLAQASRYFPLVGWLVGGFGALVFWTAQAVFPVVIAVLLAMVATIILTGAFHEDGLADTCDGLGGGTDRESVLAIMKDSRLGTYGLLGLGSVLALKLAALSGLPPVLVAPVLIAGHAASRLAAVALMATGRYLRATGSEGKNDSIAVTLSPRALALASVTGLLPMALVPPGYWVALVPVVLVAWLGSRYFNRRLGGYTGDCLGAIQQLAEAVFYLALAALVGQG